MGRLEREKLGRAWSMVDREQQIIASTQDSLLEEAGRGSSAMRRLNRRVEEIMENLKDSFCDRCRDEGKVPEREHGSRSVRASSTKKEKERPPVEVVSRDGRRVRMEELEAAGMQAFDDSRLTKLITIGGPTAICYQLWTQCGVAIWKQVKIPENGETGVLLLPARKQADRVEIPEGINQGWQSSAWPPAAAATEKKTGVTEVVLKGVTQEADGKRRNVVLFTD